MNIQVWQPILSATTSLGAQLAETKYSFKIPKVYFSNLKRLIISPLMAYALVLILGLKGMTSEIAIISSAAPTAVNSVLLVIQYDSSPDFASQTVFFSTILSCITVCFVIFLVTGKL